MSPFKFRRLFVSLESDRLAIVAMRGLWGTRIETHGNIKVSCTSANPQPALAALATAVAEKPWKNAKARVVLSSQLVKSLVVETVAGVETVAELQQAVQTRVADTFGLDPAQWEIRANLDPFAKRIIACAAPRPLLEGLRKILGPASVIEPFLISELNRWRRTFGQHGAWFGVLERHCMCVASFNHGVWNGVRTHRIGSDISSSLLSALSRDRLSYDLPEAASQLYLSGIGASSVGTPGTFDTVALGQSMWPGGSERWSRDYRLALSSLWP